MMTIGDIIAVCALLFSILATVISFTTSSKKYELATLKRTELLEWHHQVLEQLMILKEYIGTSKEFDKKLYLAKLSALIECGRFFFPNLNENKEIGKSKPLAYQGRRDQVIEHLVQAYLLCKRDDAALYLDHLEDIQKEFTSLVFMKLSPHNYNKLIERYTGLPMDRGISLEQFQQEKEKRI